MQKKNEVEQKKWAKPNVTPETGKALKRIALDQDKFVYELIEDVFRERFPEYFKPKGKITA